MLVLIRGANHSCRVQKIDLRKMEVVSEAALENIPQKILFDGSGRQFFVNDGQLTVFKTKSTA